MSIRGHSITEETVLVVETCCNCHVVFAITTEMQRELRSTHNWFYCPNGHSQHYTGKSDADKLREIERQLASREEDLRIARNRADSERASRIAVQGHLTRAKKQVARAERGVCAHCHRHFVNVERHVATKHPEQLI